MTVKEWLKETYVDEKFHTRARVVCKDGYNISIQANEFAYCTPRQTYNGIYTHVELGYPSEEDELINEYAEGVDLRIHTEWDYMNTVYPYVPMEVVEKLIEKHGGIDK